MKKFNNIVVLVLGSLLLASCAKEKEYDKVYKKAETLKISDVLTKNADGTPTKYLYVPMTLGTPREVAEANPYFQGDEKIVMLEFTKDGLEVLEIEKDERFVNNDLNNTPVLTIPVDYKQYKCAEDEFGDCTNKEEEDSDLTWDQKEYFYPDYAALEVKELNMLDLSNVEGSGCVTAKGVKLVDYEFSKDGVLNIELEKTYKLRNTWSCIRRNYFMGKLSFNSFKVRFFYSMVALDKLATKGYEKSEYAIENHSTFGFFKDEIETLNDDFDSNRKEVTYLANRWDPNKKVLTYYLSKSFNSEQNKPILEATMRSQEVMNANLASAGVGFKIQFLQQSESDNISPGDLRYNTVVLIDDPLANGLLGYAPTVTNPETGEIVQGHINMYGGVLSSGTRWVYEGAVDIMEEQVLKIGSKIVEVNFDNKTYSDSKLPAVLRKYKTTLDETEVAKSVEEVNVSSAKTHQNIFEQDHSKIIPLSMFDAGKDAAQRQFETSFDNKAYFEKIMNRDFDGMEEMNKRVAMAEADEYGYKLHSKHAPEFFPIAGTRKVVYPGLLKIANILDNRGILKRWVHLNDTQKKKVREIILVNRYTSTFVHEMGHSLGLRHNFAGSTDAANFYTDVEAQLLDMEAAPAYSSVMDYAVSEYNELGAFGKYDVAALRFNYTGTLGANDGTAVEVPKGSNINKYRELYNGEVKKFVLEQAKEAGLPADWTYEQVIGYLKENVINNEEYSEEVRNYWRGISDMDNKFVASYKFCTDENAGLSATCNRHDEGTNLFEIAKFRTQRYKEMYKYRNFRDDRLRFKSTDLDSYLTGRFREFGKVRDVMELYDLYANILGQDVLERDACKEEDIAGDIVCELNESVKVVGNMFLDILKTPELTCAVGEAATSEVSAKVTSLVKIVDIMDERDMSTLLRDNNKFLATCFDPIVKNYFKEKGQSVIGEVGKFLNSHRDSNQNYKYADDIYVRGIWTDKAMAMRFLFERRHSIGTTDESQLALIDHPYIKKEFKQVMRHMVLGKKLENPLPFLTESGEKFFIPYILEANTTTDQIEDNLGWVKNYFGMEEVGEGNLLKTLLAQVKNAYIGVQGEGKVKQFITNNYVTVRQWVGYIPEDLKIPGYLFHYAEGNGMRSSMSYQASEVNSLSNEMLTLIKEMDKFKDVPKESFEKIISHKIKPVAPDSYTDFEKSIFGLQVNQQQAIIGLLERDGITLAAFENFAGNKEDAKTMFTAYTTMRETSSSVFLEKILADKKEIVANGPIGSTDVEKELLTYELDFLTDLSAGNYTKEVIEYYEGQLSLLPQHIE